MLAIVAENKPAAVPANPAGLIACLKIRFADSETLKLVSDSTWCWAKSEVSGWDTPGFDDGAWAKARAVGRYGDAPWGQIGPPNDESCGPQATGIPGVVRVIYVPDNQPIVARCLDPHAAYVATYFDPVTGTKTALGPVRPDAAGLRRCPPPAGYAHDWVLILESPKSNAQGAESDSVRSEAHTLTLANDQLTWHFDWNDRLLRSTYFENKLSGRRFALSGVQELALNFSAVVDRVAQPFVRAADFEVRAARLADRHHAVFDLRRTSLALSVSVHVQLDGPTRRKWVEVTNQTANELLLLDVELDDFTADGTATGSGERQPVFLEGEVFAALEHPAGVNQSGEGRIQLSHYPGRRLAPGATFRSHVALVSVAKPGQALEHFSLLHPG